MPRKELILHKLHNSIYCLSWDGKTHKKRFGGCTTLGKSWITYKSFPLSLFLFFYLIRRGTILKHSLFRGGWISAFPLQVHSWRFLVGGSHNDYRWIRRYDVWLNIAKLSFLSNSPFVPVLIPSTYPLLLSFLDHCTIPTPEMNNIYHIKK